MNSTNQSNEVSLFRSLALGAVLALAAEAAWAGGLDGWHWRNPVAGANSLKGAAFGDGGFVAVGEQGTIQTSADGSAWSFRARLTTQALNRVIYANHLYVAVGESGSVLTSADGVSWNVRSLGVTNSLLAVAYGNSKYLVAGSGGLVVASSDGIVWAPVPASLGHNLSWITFGNGLFMTAGANANEVLTSADGQHWAAHPVVSTPWSTINIRPATFGNGQFLARVIVGVVDRSLVLHWKYCYYSSTNGINWNQSAVAWDSDIGGKEPQYGLLAFANGRFLEFDSSPPPTETFWVTSSENGQSWSSTELPSFWSDVSDLLWCDVVYGNGTYLVVGSTGLVLTSPEGTNWTLRSQGYQGLLTGVASGAGVIAAVGGGYRQPATDFGLTGRAMPSVASTNGQRFWVASSTATQMLASVAYGGGGFVAVGRAGALQQSTNGLNWSVRPSGTSQDLMSVCYGTNLWVAVGAAGTLVTSPNGLAWTSRTSGTGYPLFGVGYAKGLYVAVGYMGTILTSPDALTWTVQYAPTLNSLWSVAFGNDLFVVTGEKGTVLTSSDGSTWLEQSSGTTRSLYGVAFGQGRFVAVGAPGRYAEPFSANALLWSIDGIHWWDITDKLPTGWGLFGVAFVDNTFWLSGEYGTLLQSDPVLNQPLLSGRVLPGSGVYQLTIAATPGQRFRLQVSSRLDADHWEDVGSITNSQVLQPWTDSQGTTGSPRFYRLVLP